VAATAAVVAAGGLAVMPAQAANVTSAVFSGGTGTVVVDGTLYARAGAALTLTVETSDDTKCLQLAGAHTLRQTSASPKTSWTLTMTAPAGDGVRAVTVSASPDFNRNGFCTGQTRDVDTSYTVDSTGPVVTAAVSPAPNAAGWHSTGATIRWTATDAGSGVAGTQPFATESVTEDGVVTRTVAAPSDRLGNAGTPGGVTVRVDTVAPSITAAQTTHADGTTTVTFSCGDTGSGIASCVADGTTTSSRRVEPGTTVTGTAVDVAGNRSTATSTAPVRDTTAPELSGTPTTEPNAAGWYAGPVTIRWTAADPESGIPTPPADSVITGQGAGRTATTSVTNGAGLSTTATSTPVDIDTTAPTTGISGTSDDWTNDEVTLALTATDNLSGVAVTEYQVDGGDVRTGTSLTLPDEGEYTVRVWSTDRAGNVEEPTTAQVRIDRTAPTISRAFTPLTYENGAWTNQDVTVTFLCADQGGSGLADCTGPRTLTDEGVHTVLGTASDGAGNTATDTATVRIDTTAPRLGALAVGVRNAAGWYKADVTVVYSAEDDLSGVSGSPASVVLGEGADQSAEATVTDLAGNSTTAGVSGIHVDTTPPELAGSFPEGWQTDDVTVEWTCTDTLSGAAAQPAATTVTGEGADLSSTATCADIAGNEVSTTVTGVRIDRTAPTTTAEVAGTPTNGWYGAPVEITLTGADGLSGVAATYYRIDGGEPQAYDGTFTLATEGKHTLTFWSRDVAGHVEEAGAPVEVWIDTTAPETTIVNPISPDSGWFVVSGIPVAFEASDGDGSGVAATYYTIDGGEPRTYGEAHEIQLSDGVHTIAYWSVDLAGNDEARAQDTVRTVQVQVDTQAPLVTPGDVVDTTWRRTPLVATFEASDTGSGLQDDGDATFTLTASAESTATTTAPVPTVVTRTVQDAAGNATTRTVSALIDLTAPSGVTFVGGPAEGVRYYSSTVPAAPTCDATDALSGLRSCTVTGWSGAEGTHMLTATAVDIAGNTATATRTYTVKNLVRTGFHAPVDTKGVWNTIKGGNTVPLKFNVFDGTVERTDREVVRSFSAVKVTCDPAAVDDAVELFATTGQTELRYDTTGRQFIQNWKTPTGSGCYKVTMTTVDGQAITALFKTLK
jgi:hypothetical protein